MEKSVCLRYYKFLRAAKIHRKFFTLGLDPKPSTGRKGRLRILLLCCHSKSLESDASGKKEVHVGVTVNCIQ